MIQVLLPIVILLTSVLSVTTLDFANTVIERKNSSARIIIDTKDYIQYYIKISEFTMFNYDFLLLETKKNKNQIIIIFDNITNKPEAMLVCNSMCKKNKQTMTLNNEQRKIVEDSIIFERAFINE